MGGDLNICVEDIKTSMLGHSSPTYSDHLSKLLEHLNLIDIWRLQNPDSKRYTRREKTRNGLVPSRIDYFLVSCQLEYMITYSDIIPSIKSDHSLLKIAWLQQDEKRSGRGIWKLNISLLQNSQYVNLIKKTIKRPKMIVKS